MAGNSIHGQIPSGWIETRLGDLIELRGGLSYKGEFLGETGNALVTMGCVSSKERFKIDGLRRYSGEFRDNHRLVPGDIVIATRDVTQNRELIGSPALIPEGLPGDAAIAATNLYKIYNRSSSPTEFLYWVMRAPSYREEIVASAKGTTVVMLTKDSVENYRFPCPPLPEQKAIARILGTLDDKIELNRRMNATLEAMARALFQSWFVDFDPVHAKAAGRPPSDMAAPTAAPFPASFNSDDLPEGWRLGTVNELCEINSWTLGKKDELDELEYVEISEVNRGDIANISTYQRGDEPSRARRRLRHGDTAMSTVRPDRGSYFLALNPPEHRVASTGFAVVTPTKAPWSFAHIALTQPEVFERLGQLADGGAYPAVRPEVVGDLKLPIPDRPEILAVFHETCGPLLEQAEANRTQSRTLATLRDTLLPKLLCGALAIFPA